MIPILVGEKQKAVILSTDPSDILCGVEISQGRYAGIIQIRNKSGLLSTVVHSGYAYDEEDQAEDAACLVLREIFDEVPLAELVEDCDTEIAGL